MSISGSLYFFEFFEFILVFTRITSQLCHM